MFETELAKMMDLINDSNIYIKKLSDDALQEMSINKTLPMGIGKPRFSSQSWK